MARDSTSMVKIMNPHPLKIDAVKFDGKNNFEMWRCEVMDALMTLNLEDTDRSLICIFIVTFLYLLYNKLCF